VACIGQAGENLVRFASTIVDEHSSAARGSGAVWGSKNIKAIAVKGTGNVELADPEEFEKLAKEDWEFFLKDHLQHEVIAKYGTHIGMMSWWPGYKYFEKYLAADEIPEDLTPEAWKKYEIGRTGCHNCPVNCKDVFKIPTGKYAEEVGGALEYECIACMGVNCGIEDPIYYWEDFAHLIYVLTGIEKYSDIEETKLLGERISHLKRMFNIRLGWSKTNDSLHPRFTKEPMPSGPAKGEVVDLETMLREYYEVRDYDWETGFP
ncbi:unnamed protein product, partial [marine sediment metagenome]